MSRRHIILALSAAVATSVAGCSKDDRVVPQVPIEPIKDDPNAPTGDDEQPAAGGAVVAGPQTEIEPNASRAEATPLPINGALTGVLTVPVEGEPGTPDVDWYVLDLAQASQQVRVQLSPSGNDDLVLEWMPETAAPQEQRKKKRRKRRRKKKPVDTDPPLARLDTGGDGAVEVMPPTVLAPGRHYFQVRRAKKRRKRRRKAAPPPQRDAPYRIVTTVIDPEPALEQEPNTTREQAGDLRPGEPRAGYLGWSRDEDWYRLALDDAADGALVRVDVTGLPDVRGRLWLTDRRGKSLVKTPESGVAWPAGRGVTIRDVAVDRKNLPYYVQVATTNGSNIMTQYEVSLTVEVPETPRESEPNWSPGLAQLIEPDHPVDGFIGHPTDWDTFRLESRTPVMATVVTSAVPDVDLKLELIDHRKTIVRTIDDAGIGGPETLALIAVGPETAYVRVSSQKHTYHVDKGYRIAVTMSEVGNRELEPNDDLTQGRRAPLREGVDIEGFVHPRGDVDVFAFDIQTTDDEPTRTMSVYLRGVDGLNLGMELLDAKGALITRKRGIGAQTERHITHEFSGGRYYVRVRELSSSASNADDPYLIRFGPPPAADSGG